jgi:hypothetical protein
MVRRFQSLVATNTAFDVLFHSSTFIDFCHSIVLVHAYSVLQETLLQLRDEGRFPRGGRQLERLLDQSADHLPWLDIQKVREGKLRRDAVAHKRQTVPTAECWEYIRTIERELEAWGGLPQVSTADLVDDDYSPPTPGANGR